MKALSLLLIASIIFLAGCIHHIACGNLICEDGENPASCPTDCALEPSTCKQLGGYSCQVNEICSGEKLNAFDADLCCSTKCNFIEKPVIISGECKSNADCNDFDETTNDYCTGYPQKCVNELKTCSELNGSVCGLGGTCNGKTINSADEKNCCTGNCSKTSLIEVANWQDLNPAEQSEEYSLLEGEALNGLEGQNFFEGKTLALQLQSVFLDGQFYRATFNLYTDNGLTLVDNVTVKDGSQLRPLFKGPDGLTALKQSVSVHNIFTNHSAGLFVCCKTNSPGQSGFTEKTVTIKEGTSFVGLDGKNSFKEQKLTLRLESVSSTGPGQPPQATFILLNQSGTKIGSVTTSGGIFLNNEFKDSQGTFALKTMVFVNLVAVNQENGIGETTITITEENI